MSTTEQETRACTPTPLAIVGIGCLFPKAESTPVFWANIKGGVDAITDVPATHWRPDDYFNSDPSAPDMTYGRRGAFLEEVDFNPLEFGISPNNIEAIDTTQLLGLLVAQQALRDAGYATGKDATDGRPFNRERASVILGVTGALELVIPLGARLGHPIWRRALREAGVEPRVAEDVVRRIADAYVPWQENSFPGLLGNVAAGRIANRFDTGGTNCVVDAACGSSLAALHMAAMELYSGRSDIAITGGIDTFNDIFMYMCFSKTPALSPTGNSRPFSVGADGTILGEGIGIVVLKRLADAQRDGDHIRAIIRGIGSSSDGKGNAVYAPSVQGQVRCLLSAYGQAGVAPQTVELIEAHGTGTKVGDVVEAKALEQVFHKENMPGPWCALGSVKSMVGHTKAAAGMAGLIKAALALEQKVLPPTLKVDKPLEALEPGESPLYVNTQKRPWMPRAEHPRRAGVSAFGFGGSNFHCVLEEAGPRKQLPDWDDSVLLLPLSAETPEQLAAALGEIDPKRTWKELRSQGARLRRTFDRAACRLVLVAQKDQTDVAKLVQGAQRMLQQQGQKKSWSTPDGAYFGRGKPGRLGVLFPGQGSQYVGMLRDLACQFPEMLDTLAEADQAFGQMAHGRRLSDRTYPVPVFSDEARKANERSLNDTRVAQPAIGAVSLGAWQVLRTFGVRADAMAGHSFGELVALCAASRMTPAALHALACLRGKAMAEAATTAGRDPGSMLAVVAEAGQVQQLIETEKLDLVIANKNAPSQVVLSGKTAEIERAAAALERRGIRSKRLPVSAAFHSPLVAEAQRTLAAALEKVTLGGGETPVYANSTADLYPEEARAAATLLAGQLARPVEFVGQIEAMYAAGVRTFVEAGPSNKLSGLVRAILGEREHETAAIDASSGKRSGLYDLGCTLAHLAALGYAVDLTPWDAACAAPAEMPRKPALTVRLCGANYVKPRSATGVRPPVAAPAVGTPHAQQEGRNPLTQAPIPPSSLHSNAPAAPTGAVPATSAVPPVGLAQALQATQQSLLMLQKMQEQTAHLHQQYLQGQEVAQRTIHQLVAQQMQLLSSACGMGVPAVMPVPATLPMVQTAAHVIPAPIVTAPAAVAVPVVEPPRVAEAVQATPVPAMPASVAAAVPAANDRIQSVLLEVIAEKTGYPVEMLELDMGLDTDLGIDSIKRVEILSALQTRLPEAPVVKPEDLGRLQTLRQIVAFLKPETAVQATPVPAMPASVAAAVPAANDRIQSVLLEVIAEKTGYPVEMLELDMGLDTDLGIDSIKRVEILSALQTRLPEAPVVKPEDLGRLQTLRQIVAFLQNGAAAASPSIATPAMKAESPKKAEASSHRNSLDRQVLTIVPLGGPESRPTLTLASKAPVWVTDDGAGLARKICKALQSRHLEASVIRLENPAPQGPLAGLLILSPTNPSADFIHEAFKLIQRVGPQLRQTGRGAGAFLASASRLDGCFALNGHTPRSPITGGLAGLVKTAAHEWPEVACKSLDLAEEGAGDEKLAEQIAEELLLKGPSEVGISKGGRCEPRLVRQPLNGEAGKVSLAAEDVVVVTGGARGVTAAVSLALARAYRCRLLLLGRSPLPTPEPEWLSGVAGEAAIKKILAARLEGPASPRALEESYRRVLANREIQSNLEQIQAAGAQVMYRSLDVRDAAAVAGAVAEARRTCGPVRALIHGAGVLQDRLIEQKTAEQFDEVFSTKVDGFQSLLKAVQGDDLKVIVAFSSSTGRFGRKGQVAYAAANEVLNKLAQQEAHQRPGCRVLSMNWGPWEGGMVTPQLRRIFENEGVGLIPLNAGADYLVREMSTPAGGPVEIVILGPEPGAAAPAADIAEESGVEGEMPVAFERELSVETHPVLRSHVMKGKAVLPMALMVEWLAHGAMHENPGLLFHGFDDLRIFKGVTLHPKESLAVRVLAGAPVAENGMERVPVELRSGKVLHARATIVLAGKLPQERASATPAAGQAYSGEKAKLYKDGRLFHGEQLHGIRSVEGWSEEGIIGHLAAAPSPGTWMRQPLRSSWLADPLTLDAAFQLMILWCFETRGTGSLPTGAARYRQYARNFPETGVRCQIRVTQAGEHSAEAVMEFLDRVGHLVGRIDGYTCVMDATLKESFARNRLATV